jgi:RES domain
MGSARLISFIKARSTKQLQRQSATTDMALTNPPADLRNQKVPLAGIPVQLFRLNLIRHRDPVHWSKQGRYRFDSATAKYGVFYTSAAVETAILEVFGDRWIQERYLAQSDLMQYEVCKLEIRSGFEAVNAVGRNLNRLGTDSNLFASTDYQFSQAWGREFMIHPQCPSGIRYHSRKNPRRIDYALFGTDMLRTSIKVSERYPLRSYPRLYSFLLSYGVAMI